MTEKTKRKRLRTPFHVSYKPQEYGLLDMEAKLMEHFCMNRSDVHKHLIRTTWDQVFGYQSPKRSTND